MVQLTHDDIVRVCLSKAVSFGWHKLPKDILLRTSSYQMRPDLVLSRSADEEVCIFEVKPPDVTFNEIIKGIGQCVQYKACLKHPRGTSILLVVHEEHLLETIKSCAVIQWLGVIGYNRSGEITPVNKDIFVPYVMKSKDEIVFWKEKIKTEQAGLDSFIHKHRLFVNMEPYDEMLSSTRNLLRQFRPQ